MSLKGLGRGLDALLPVDSMVRTQTGLPAAATVVNIPVDLLIPNPNQPRKSFNQDALEELAKSIRNAGVIQPLLVRKSKSPGKYEIIAGERRWRAACMAQLTDVPVYMRELSDNDALIIALIENLQREDLNPAEEAMAIQGLKEKLDLTQEELATRLGKSRSMVANSLRLLQLPKNALISLQKGEINAGHARCLLTFAQDPELLDAFLRYMVEHKLSVRACEEIVETWKSEHTLPWVSDASTLPIPEKPKALRKRKYGVFVEIEQSLSSLLPCKPRISGNGQTGKLSFSYRNEEELRTLLAALGVANVPEHFVQEGNEDEVLVQTQSEQELSRQESEEKPLREENATQQI